MFSMQHYTTIFGFPVLPSVQDSESKTVNVLLGGKVYKVSGYVGLNVYFIANKVQELVIRISGIIPFFYDERFLCEFSIPEHFIGRKWTKARAIRIEFDKTKKTSYNGAEVIDLDSQINDTINDFCS